MDIKIKWLGFTIDSSYFLGVKCWTNLHYQKKKKKNSKKCLGCFLKENKNIYKESALEVKIIKSHTLFFLKRNSVICFTKNATD